MIIMNLNLKHILGFDDANFNFSYARKPKKSTIGIEHLQGIESFNYKKVNVIIGSNSTGKSSLGKIIWGICLFLRKKESVHVTNLLSESADEGFIGIDYVTRVMNHTYVLNRVYIKIKRTDSEANPFDVLLSYQHSTLRKGDTYDKVAKTFTTDFYYLKASDCFDEIVYNSGFHVVMPLTEKGFETFEFNFEETEISEYCIVLNKVLRTLDPNIKEVTVSKETNNAFIVKYNDEKRNVIVQKGTRIADLEYLSSGTKYGFSIAKIMYAISIHKNGLYFVDEMFSYINSDIEIAALTTMVTSLGEDEQLFFTTHNTDILSLPFPLHSFSFLGKEIADKKTITKFISASDVEKRNNVFAKNLYENDMFGISPSTSLLFSIGEQKNE